MDNVRTENKDGILIITVDRPKVLNALNAQTVGEIGQAFEEARNDDSVKAVILTGAGEKAFVAGADIAAMTRMTPMEAREFAMKAMRLMRSFESAPFAVIALVNGYALGGGCELAMACDWIVAAENAQFGQPEVNLGICPGFGGTQRLPRLVGKAMALEMCITGRALKATEALRVGLINQIVAPGTLIERGMELARTIAAKGPLAVAQCKHLIQHGPDLDLENALRLEADNFAMLCATEDKREGMTAFVEKRPARFTGR
jgi:enoyl-CoA hydratase